MVAYPVSAINSDVDAIIFAGVNLDWMSRVMSNLVGRPGISAVLVDRVGTVQAAPPDEPNLIGKSLDDMPMLSTVAQTALDSNQHEGSLFFVAADGSKRELSFARIADTGSRLIALSRTA